MLFTDEYSVIRNKKDDWFDPDLAVDTRLFVDPFLLSKEKRGRWAKGYAKIVAHYQAAFDLVAACGCDPKTLDFKAALRMLEFPEPRETCLGYTSQGTSGSGGGTGYARFVAAAMGDAIGRGMTALAHFEQLGILSEGIGPDRISDMTCTVLKPELIAYTREVAAARGVPMVSHKIRAGAFDAARKGFATITVELPTNPATGGAVLLVPERFLRELPSINAEDWWEAVRGSQVRDELNLDLMGRMNKKAIVAVARKHPEKVDAWVRMRERDPGEPYDLVRDPLGVYGWRAARHFVKANPAKLANATNEIEFATVIDTICEKFKHYVEENGGWKLLWDDDDPKPESAAQLLFLGIARAYCEANGIRVDREVELGRGPVDFIFNSGYTHRALLEVKKLENGYFWNGLYAQLPAYLKSDGSRDGWLLAIRFKSSGVSRTRARKLRNEVKKAAKDLDLGLRYALVDARPKSSASRLKSRLAGAA